MAVYVLLLVFNRMGITVCGSTSSPVFSCGISCCASGVHATLAGVLLAFAIPFGNGDKHSPSYHLQHALHKPVAFIIMPIFALANTGIILSGNWFSGLGSDNSLGIMSGLLLGKPIGVVLMTWIAWPSAFQITDSINWRHIIGTGFWRSWFTMSIFITLLAFDNAATVQMSKSPSLPHCWPVSLGFDPALRTQSDGGSGRRRLINSANNGKLCFRFYILFRHAVLAYRHYFPRENLLLPACLASIFFSISMRCFGVICGLAEVVVMFMQTVLHFFDETRGLAVFKIAPGGVLTPGDMQTQARARNADIHQPPLFLNAQGLSSNSSRSMCGSNPSSTPTKTHVGIPALCVQCGQPHPRCPRLRLCPSC